MVALCNDKKKEFGQRYHSIFVITLNKAQSNGNTVIRAYCHTVISNQGGKVIKQSKTISTTDLWF